MTVTSPHKHNCFECGKQQECNIQDCQIEEDEVTIFLCSNCEAEVDQDEAIESLYEEEYEDDDDIVEENEA